MKLLLSCEHAFNNIPQEYEELFENVGEMLNSHRGYDPGAFDLFKDLEALADFSHFQKISRLLIEVNRSLHHPALFSKFTQNLSSAEKEKIIQTFYLPYRNSVEKKISAFLKEGEKVLHLSVHSFTPIWKGMGRSADIGLLYDPSRSQEKEIATELKKKLLENSPNLKVRFNYPYLGKADGFTTYLRRKFPENYAGIELEVNQKFVNSGGEMQREVKLQFKAAFEELLESIK